LILGNFFSSVPRGLRSRPIISGNPQSRKRCIASLVLEAPYLLTAAFTDTGAFHICQQLRLVSRCRLYLPYDLSTEDYLKDYCALPGFR
jgi:hypothetical protein